MNGTSSFVLGEDSSHTLEIFSGAIQRLSGQKFMSGFGSSALKKVTIQREKVHGTIPCGQLQSPHPSWQQPYLLFVDRARQPGSHACAPPFPVAASLRVEYSTVLLAGVSLVPSFLPSFVGSQLLLSLVSQYSTTAPAGSQKATPHSLYLSPSLMPLARLLATTSNTSCSVSASAVEKIWPCNL